MKNGNSRRAVCAYEERSPSRLRSIAILTRCIALVELSRGTNSELSQLDAELPYDYYMWANRRERRHANWKSFADAGTGPTILRWYGAMIERSVDCAICSTGEVGLGLDLGEDVEAQLASLPEQ